MLKRIYISGLILFAGLTTHAQTYFDFGYSFGANATTSRTVESPDQTWGYYTPPLPSTWNNCWSVGWGNRRNRVYAVFEGGGLGPTWQVRAYPDRFPYSDKPDIGNKVTNYSTPTGISGRSRHNSNLLKVSLLYKHTWNSTSKWQHSNIVGAGYLKTRIRNGNAVVGNAFYDDSLGWVNHSFVMDQYAYFRTENLYLTLGYQFTYKPGDRWNFKLQVLYNQGLFQMIRWHTYRSYSESLTGYTEFDQQWSFTRLSYFSFLAGVSFDLVKSRNR